ncbi:MAG: gliding motility-associated C-terminal domain-containing protein [Bacteroidetes bacterium]|nr:MAG: gliding motility-associated C-terminal domain-containing protein [Bacteroidota bacterium]
MKRKACIFLLLLGLMILPMLTQAQKENNIWYFGVGCGLDFSTTPPTPLSNGKINTNEGCSSVSDGQGNLLFYTDGISVWNKNHTVMDSGTGLKGNSSATQSSVVVKAPCTTDKYYIFTADCLESPVNASHYSVVEMQHNGGLGKVVEKNTVLFNGRSSEKITCVKDNAGGFWIIIHPIGSDAFHSYHLTSTGLDPTPVISNQGHVYENSGMGFIGYLKSSPDGKKIAACIVDARAVEIFDFDNATGKLSNHLLLDSSTNGPYYYGCSFSPDSKLFYAASLTGGGIYQFDVSLPTDAEIVASKTRISTTPGTPRTLGAMQLAADGKIYVAVMSSKKLDVIGNPNQKGVGCGYVEGGIVMTGMLTFVRLGLPNFIENPNPFGLSVDLGPDTSVCNSNSITIKPSSLLQGTYLWNTGATTTSISVATSGTYWLKITAGCEVGYDTIKVTQKNAGVTIDLGKDTIVCNKQHTLELPPPPNGVTYKWFNESSAKSVTITQSGKYWVKVNTPCGLITDTINVTLIKDSIAPIQLGNDTVICGTSYTLGTTSAPQVNYLWNTGDTFSTLTINKTGMYWLKAENACYKKADTINVEFVQDSVLSIDLGNDSLLCGSNLMLDAGYFYKAKYLWSTGDTTRTIVADTIATYSVMVTTYGCKNVIKDTINVMAFYTTPLKFPNDTDICNHHFADGFDLSPKGFYTHYNWSTGSTEPKFIAKQPGNYALQVRDTCGFVYNDDITIIVNECICDLFVPNAFTPDGDGLNDVFYVSEYCGLIKYRLWIFNRWGEVMFETNNPTATWDGTYKGQAVPEGVYGVLIDYTFDKLPTKPEYRGNLTIMR